MPSVVFVRAMNVGGTNRCQPSLIAKQLSKFVVTNIGAVGTFIVRKNVSASVLCAEFARKLLFKCEIMICPAKEIVDLIRRDPFAGQVPAPNITRFVMVLHKPLCLPFNLPSADESLISIIAIQNRFVLGSYRRQMKAIGYLSRIEKLLGVPATTRSWNTIQKVAGRL